MLESTDTALLVKGRLDEELVDRALEAARQAAPGDRVEAAVEAAVDLIEADPDVARVTLWELRGNHSMLRLLETGLGGGSAARATLALGAAIQLLDAELVSPVPDPRNCIPELLRWLQGGW